MPIPLTSDADLDRHFEELGLKDGDDVLVHSRLLSCGRLEHGAASVYDALKRAIGDRGTLIVPSFNLYMPEGYVFDPVGTPPQSMGSLTNYVWDLGGWTRSACPIHSHLAIGPKAHMLSDVSGNVSLGDGCDFEQFLKHEVNMLMLGLSYTEGASYMHYVEYVTHVPYRVPLELARKRMNANGEAEDIIVQYYGRPTADLRDGNKHRAYNEHYVAVEEQLIKDGQMKRVRLPFGYSTYIPVKTAHETAVKMVEQDPYAMVTKNTDSAP